MWKGRKTAKKYVDVAENYSLYSVNDSGRHKKNVTKRCVQKAMLAIGE